MEKEQDKKKYILLKDLEVYQLSKEFSKIGWDIYQKLTWQEKKIIGDQFITSTDSVGANIAEGYGRYHYLDKIKFLYNARGSLWEAMHWSQLLQERELIDKAKNKKYDICAKELSIKLQRFITSLYTAKKNNP
jgi:four helix bundle protein